MSRFAAFNDKPMNYKGQVMPKPWKRLAGEIEHSENWFAIQSSEYVFEITHTLFTNKFIVDLARHTCSCNFWDLIGIPCRHAISTLTTKWPNANVET